MRLIWPALLVLAASCGVADDGAMPVVTGAFGSKPVVTIPKAAPARVPRVTVLSEGAGRRTAPGDVVLADVDIRRWSDGRSYLSTYDAHQPASVVLDGRLVAETWRDSLIGRPAGSRVMLVGPAAKALGPEPRPDGVSPSDTLVVVFDVLGGYPPDARLVGRTLPAPPADLAPADPPRVLIDGSGPPVAAGSKVVVQYAATSWPDRRALDSSYRRGGPAAYTLRPGAVPDAWLDALVGQHVGARVAVPDRTSQAVYVIDVLDALAQEQA